MGRMHVPQANWKEGSKVVRPSMLQELIDGVDNATSDVLDAAGYHVRCEGLIDMMPSLAINRSVAVLKLNRKHALCLPLYSTD